MAPSAHVLVLASLTATSGDLIAALQERARRSPARFTLLMPGQGPGLAGRKAVEPQLQEALEQWRAAGLEADGVTGDSDPIDAVSEVWNPATFDEVIVSTLPGQASKWLRWDMPHRVAQLTGALVTHVTAMDMRPEPAHGPPPVHEKSPLGPLGVLAWGGKRD
ncbi:MAG TPA: hypothetical protein VN213_15235 [Solirubrobacteraceae bacterium]|nr:hypothetical protein [Solirubrobacteraceae bacterium]